MAVGQLAAELRTLIQDVPDFPKKGVLFRDITTLLRDGRRLWGAIDTLGERYATQRPDAVVSVEARGFIIGATLAYRLGVGLVPVRKPGKLPRATHAVTYQLEYGSDTLEIHRDALTPGQRVVIADDLLATGGTTQATIALVEQLGARVQEAAFLIELTALGGRQRLSRYPIVSLVQY